MTVKMDKNNINCHICGEKLSFWKITKLRLSHYTYDFCQDCNELSRLLLKPFWETEGDSSFITLANLMKAWKIMDGLYPNCEWLKGLDDDEE